MNQDKLEIEPIKINKCVKWNGDCL
ncbi:hypothetical protein V12B01_22980 [Vibrio splendidus 12B01]|nr:hypothetical protein V12B01_22980 [Vibrio splendidus 12B01]